MPEQRKFTLARQPSDSPVPVVHARSAGPRRIALVAHDNKKRDLLDWARFNRPTLAEHTLFATGTTGRLIEDELGLDVTRFKSGPLGGDQQLGAKISDGEIDLVLFFWDPLEPQPHDPDVRALLRIAVVWNVAIACNRATADYLISSPLLDSDYSARLPSYETASERSAIMRSHPSSSNRY
jgi:methylglyoxal synthase